MSTNYNSWINFRRFLSLLTKLLVYSLEGTEALHFFLAGSSSRFEISHRPGANPDLGTAREQVRALYFTPVVQIESK